MPQIDKVLQICELFGISTDELLRDKIAINVGDKNIKNKYFGTDGFRGEANLDLTSYQAYKVGRFLGWYYSQPFSGVGKIGVKPKMVIGKDTRRSSYMLEYSIAAGITASGADAYMLHVTTTPSVSYVARQDDFDCGIMITASHNPFYDNGIKIINRYGEKLDDETTSLIEAYLDGDMSVFDITDHDLPLATKEKIGSIIDYSSGRNRYIAYLISLASHSYKHLRIGLDCANGSSWMIANAVFSALGAKTEVIGVEPNGLNINKDCGSTHIEKLSALVREKHLDVGFAFDGDGDRCYAVDEYGNVIDGDKILFVLGNRLKRKGNLNKDTVVTTYMSNSGIVSSLEKKGLKNVQTSVGDRFVYECMQQEDYSLGGEHSGHIIIKKYATTGDGLLTAIMLTEEMCDTKQTLAQLTKEIILLPQYTKNIKVKNKDEVANDEDVKKVVSEITKEIGKYGRILIRKSGTEPLIRIMVECETQQKCISCAERVAEVIYQKGYSLERKNTTKQNIQEEVFSC
ncbi:MAG: phosphoglucosamine mutase [Clostridia bacterium]|nr:phosphoglucosamine mutase [Clostridia bacterium]